jgi:acylphosphatase
MTGKERLHAEVFGEVQGVGFRAFVMRRALGYGLTGWVRNRLDGSVEVVAEGPRAALETLLADLHAGPRTSMVNRVEEEWSVSDSEFMVFGVR